MSGKETQLKWYRFWEAVSNSTDNIRKPTKPQRKKLLICLREKHSTLVKLRFLINLINLSRGFRSLLKYSPTFNSLMRWLSWIFKKWMLLSTSSMLSGISSNRKEKLIFWILATAHLTRNMSHSIYQSPNLIPNFNSSLTTTLANQSQLSTALTCLKSLSQQLKGMPWNTTSHQNTTPFWQTMLPNLRPFKESSTTRNLIHQSLEICRKMQEKLYGQSTCIRKSQGRLLNFHKMSFIPPKLKSITVIITHLEKCSLSMKCGIMIYGSRKSKDPRLHSKLLWLWDIRLKRNFMLTSMSISCNLSDRLNV